MSIQTDKMTTAAAAKIVGAEQVDANRYVVCWWQDRQAQYVGHLPPKQRWVGYRYSVARTPAALGRLIGTISARQLRDRAKRLVEARAAECSCGCGADSRVEDCRQDAYERGCLSRVAPFED